MDSDGTFEDLAKSWQSIAGTTVHELKQEILSKQIPELKKFNTGLGTSALNIFDIEENRFLYVDDHIEKVTGIPREAYFSKGPKYLLTKASLTHIPQLISTTFHQRRFLSGLQTDQLDNFIVNREFAYANGAARRWVLHQTIKHLVNTKGLIFAAAVLQTRIDRVKLDNKFRYYIFDRENNVVTYPRPKDKEMLPKEKLSEREREIVTLLAHGESNKEIAEKLHISFHTVRTHRKNIFKKLGCSNIIELLQQW